MIKNGLTGYGRLLLTVVFISVVVLLSGCCELCDLDKCCPKLDCANCEPDCSKCPAPKQVQDDCKYCDMDIVYAFNIPTEPGDCPEDTTFIDYAKSAGLKIHDGGAGVIDRDGGMGVVDRKGIGVVSFCRLDCAKDETGKEIEEHVGDVVIRWSYESKFIVVEDICQ